MKYDKFSGIHREDQVRSLENALKSQQLTLRRPQLDSEKCVKVSYVISEKIAKYSKSFGEGEFVKECLLAAVETLCPQEIDKFKQVSLSRNTVTRRIEEIGEDIEKKLKTVAESFSYYSLALDESTDLSDTAQLSIFIRGKLFL